MRSRQRPRESGPVQDGTYPQGQALLGVGVFPGQGAPAEADFDDLVVTKR